MTKRVHMVFDAIHKTMRFEETPELKKEIVRIMDSPIFQRLKGIKQLGFSDMVFPTAVHTRFSHSIGTAYLCARTLSLLKIDDDKMRRLAILASLLHDIGHGPFSHTIEQFIKKNVCKKYTHELWAKRFIAEGRNHGSEVYGKWAISEDDENVISNLIRGDDDNTRKTYGVIADLISSQLDVDRLDYLLRDSHFCGVEYGCYDLEWLLCSLQIYPEVKGKYEDSQLGVSYKGVGALENYLMNRRLMTQNIYYHKVVKGFEHVFACWLGRLCDVVDHSELNGLVSDRLRGFVRVLHKLIDEAGGDVDRVDEKRILEDGFHYYAELCDYDFWFSMRNIANATNGDHRLRELSRRFLNRETPLMIPISGEHICAEREVARFEHLGDESDKRCDIFVCELDFEMYKTHKKPIVIIDEAARPQPVQDRSEVLRRMGDAFEKKYYLFIGRQYFNDNKAPLTELLRKIKCPEKLFEKYGMYECPGFNNYQA